MRFIVSTKEKNELSVEKLDCDNLAGSLGVKGSPSWTATTRYIKQFCVQGQTHIRMWSKEMRHESDVLYTMQLMHCAPPLQDSIFDDMLSS